MAASAPWRWLDAAHRVAEACLATATGNPDTGRRLLEPVRRTHPAAGLRWLTDRLVMAIGEDRLIAGDPTGF